MRYLGHESLENRDHNTEQLDGQQSRKEAQSDTYANHNQHEFRVISKIRDLVPPVQNLAQLRNGHHEDGCQRDEGADPTVHV